MCSKLAIQTLERSRSSNEALSPDFASNIKRI